MAVFKAQEVVAVIDVFPGLLGLPEAILKFTAFPESATVSNGASTACRAIVLAPELRACP
jgi:hypothetical protein